MANVVLTYTGNVCSTPMVSYARNAGAIFMPAYEEFEHRIFTPATLGEGDSSAILLETLQALFERRSAPYLETPALAEFRDGGPIPKTRDKPHLFFKWRCNAITCSHAREIAELFAEHKVQSVVMLRKSLIEQAIKIQLSNIVYDSEHPQFAASSLRQSEYAAYRESQSDLSITLQEADLDSIVHTGRRYFRETKKRIEQTRFYFGHAEIRKIIAEDIFKPDIDIAAYNKVLRRLFGRNAYIQPGSEASVRKGGLDLSHCANPELVLADPRIKRLERRYQRLIAPFPNVMERRNRFLKLFGR